MLSTHIYTRFFFASAVLFLAIRGQSVWVPVLMIPLLIGALWCVLGHGDRLIHLLKLLRWFVVPILLVHAFFTPGERLLGLPVSWEGIERGTWICLHFVCMFLAAMLFASLIRTREWLAIVAKVPFIQKNLWSYNCMLLMMSRSISSLLRDFNKQWRLRRSWKVAPVMLLGALRSCMDMGASQARDVWLRWPEPHVWRQSGTDLYVRDVSVAGGWRYSLNIGFTIGGIAVFLLALQ